MSIQARTNAAMGTQTEIAEKIKQKHAGYTLAVKENQKINL